MTMRPNTLDAIVDALQVILGISEVRFSSRVHFTGWGELAELFRGLAWEMKMNVEPKGRVQIDGRMYDYVLKEDLPGFEDKLVVAIDVEGK